MIYINITHNLDNLSVEQISEFKIVEKLLSNLNSLKPSHVPINKLDYKNEKFRVTNFGYAHRFLLDDIEQAMLNNVETHKKFILEEVRQQFKDYDTYKNSTSFLNTKTFLETLIKYYSDYPLYLENDDFKYFIENLSLSINKELSKG